MNTVNDYDIIAYYCERAEYYEERDVSQRSEDVGLLQGICHDLLHDADVLELACGTGIWTRHLSQFVKSILATDANLNMLKIAQQHLSQSNNVTFSVIDAYDLRSIKCKFTAGFAGWWLSHVDKNRIRDFLKGFHEILMPDSIVIFMDDTPMVLDGISSIDKHCNSYTKRTLRNGTTYEIIKNFLNEASLEQTLAGIAYNVRFYKFTYHWLLSYNVLDPSFQREEI